MLKTVVKKGSYHDSVVLMLLTNHISAMQGVNKVSIMMATPANKDIFKQSGLDTEELLAASANDMVVVADIENETIMDTIETEIDAYFKKQNTQTQQTESVKSWDKALEKMPNADMAVISIAGAYAALEANRALDEGMNVFMFSDNVTIEDEKQLKQRAHDKGLVVMGPDCGTGIIQSVPIAFTNKVNSGKIGIIGASGTGIQELTTIIDRLGEGVKNAIGTGGRDLSSEIGGITMMDTINAMEQDDSIKVMIVISKPPAKAVREMISNRLSAFKKPVVTLFLGEKPEYHEEGFYHAYTLDEAARLAVNLVRDEDINSCVVSADTPENAFDKSENKTIKAYYSGGTLAGEAAMLIKDALNLDTPPEKAEGFMLKHGGHIVVDLGDDVYTQGKPHPMIDPAKRIECMQEATDDSSTGVILFDIMLGYGSHEDMAGALLPTINELKQKAENEGRKLFFIATVCGTRHDYQGYDDAVNKLKNAGVIVCETNKLASQMAIRAIGLDFAEPKKEIRAKQSVDVNITPASDKLLKMLSEKPRIINIGLKSFAEVADEFGCEVVQFDWTPPAGGNVEMIKTLDFLRNFSEFDIDAANREVIAKIVASQPVMIDNVRAKEVIPEMAEGKVILHAGPPIEYKNMPDPVQGSCVGAVLFEEWADNGEDARKLLASGEIKLIPCHHVNAVGPMGGITSPNMPVFVVENRTDGNRAYCTMNEGIGKVLRFGAYSEEVVNRLRWMRDILGPTLGKAIRELGGIDVNPLMAKALAMGDEFHQRNIAASLSFLKEVAPVITKLDMDEKDRYDVIRFLSDTDQFFLNIMMATGKAVMDAARTIQKGTIVTAMCRNGVEFGIRIAGMGDEWFTGPVNTPKGLYFTGYDEEDACPDMGDSAITETFGVGGMAMIAAPAVTRFVGAGGYEDALRTSNDMMEICIDRNPNFIIPNWNFQGICLGIDARLVVEKGITPVINTGIAHKIAGFGQVGAGTVHPPIECFEKAIAAYAKKLGFTL
ncbi:MAG TPA: acyl-CoA synthetase FdrA [Candidatus Butyricicoccus avistercoris]|uniref:Acyl-CoA synthetase FdrA n=1 Tax=Candidatus Butyricicoccus avistercoris TaxID=2838518 RepID=A0A9D1TIH2_9FIRM|nr:acyl-CoA synthetase FdrA [Candidatus Butyricicoccus avistercoris]